MVIPLQTFFQYLEQNDFPITDDIRAKYKELLQDEFDEDHALDEVFNNMVEDLDEEDLKEQE
jgi:hypothetical protein